MANVLMLLSNPYRPDPRVQREARALAEAGHSVAILSWDREGLGKAADTAGVEKGAEEGRGRIRVVRLGPRAGYSSALDMALKLPLFWERAALAAMRERFDVVHAHDFDTLPLGVALSWLRGVPLVYDAHERYSDMVAGSVPNSAISFIISMEKHLLGRATLLVTVNDIFAREFSEKGARKSIAVMNCPEISHAAASGLRDKLGVGNRFLLLYIGVLEPERSLLEAVEAFKGLPKEDFFLAIGGFGSLDGRLREAAKGLPHVRILERVPSSDVVPHTMAADAVLVCFDPSNRNNRDGAPNKMFEAMAAGKPYIAAEGTYIARVASEEGCGLAVRYGDAKALAEAITKMQQAGTTQYSNSARKAYSEKYNWGVMRKRLLDAYASILR